MEFVSCCGPSISVLLLVLSRAIFWDHGYALGTVTCGPSAWSLARCVPGVCPDSHWVTSQNLQLGCAIQCVQCIREPTAQDLERERGEAWWGCPPQSQPSIVVWKGPCASPVRAGAQVTVWDRRKNAFLEQRRKLEQLVHWLDQGTAEHQRARAPVLVAVDLNSTLKCHCLVCE